MYELEWLVEGVFFEVLNQERDSVTIWRRLTFVLQGRAFLDHRRGDQPQDALPSLSRRDGGLKMGWTKPPGWGVAYGICSNPLGGLHRR
jgi:hypothetical protein